MPPAREQIVELIHAESILNHFLNLQRANTTMVLWQNLNLPNRLKHKAKLTEVDIQKRELEFAPKGESFDFDPAKVIYFLSHKRTSLFKTNILFNTRDQLFLDLPVKMMIKNTRTQNREISNGTVQLSGGSLSLQDKYFKANLIDISEGGFAFLSSRYDINRYRAGVNLKCKFEGSDEVVHAQVVNSVDHYNPKVNRIDTRVCVKFI